MSPSLNSDTCIFAGDSVVVVTTTKSSQPQFVPQRLFSNTGECRSIFIQMQTTPNDDSIRFILGLGVMGEGIAEFCASRTALKSSLVYSILMEQFPAGLPLFGSRETAVPQDNRILDMDSEPIATIKELVDSHVRFAIMEDDGDIEYQGFSDEGLVEVKWKESCRGPWMKRRLFAIDEVAKLEQRLATNGNNKDFN
ncbi:uncharacterized protein BJ212DRAFT_1443290 [Suillus subaureus]|uniref:Uncharacterized protein n=1 Tax=Suillus subaureus TaxID=48587 RepID=A0A9P7EQ49_9AGAM|nr:uncharacterized protein BJ212DRAFT_1443290 [Suillus subaureus]KAG1827138.1 hypothetical protein BJ212DRAFT_1443290 [Suillus subaureus]